MLGYCVPDFMSTDVKLYMLLDIALWVIFAKQFRYFDIYNQILPDFFVADCLS